MMTPTTSILMTIGQLNSSGHAGLGARELPPFPITCRRQLPQIRPRPSNCDTNCGRNGFLTQASVIPLGFHAARSRRFPSPSGRPKPTHWPYQHLGPTVHPSPSSSQRLATNATTPPPQPIHPSPGLPHPGAHEWRKSRGPREQTPCCA